MFITGKPAPTVDSFRYRAPDAPLLWMMALYRPMSPEKAFLLGVTTWIPFSSHRGYRAATLSEDVLSTRATRSFAWTNACNRSVKACRSAFSDEAASIDFQSSVGWIGFVELKTDRVDEDKEISLNGDTFCGMESS